MNRKRLFVGLVISFFFLVMFGQSLVVLYTDWLWFKSLNSGFIFTRILDTQAILWLGFGILSGLLFYVNGMLCNRFGGALVVAPGQSSRFSVLAHIAGNIPRSLKIGSVVIGIIMGLYAAARWEYALNFLHGLSFSKTDPVFGHDIGFYVFDLPFVSFVLSWGFRMVFLMFLTAVVILVLRLQITITPEGVNLRFPAKRLAMIYGAVFFFLTGGHFLLGRYDILYQSRGVVFGAGYADLYGRLPALNLMVAISILTGGACLYSFFRYRAKVLFSFGGVFILTYLLGVQVYPMILQRFVVTPNELEKEAPYLRRDIDSTREGYNISSVDERGLSAAGSLTEEVLARNDLTIKNIRLWDHQPLLETYSQIQEIRTYYKFLSVDNDRYYLDGEYRQVMLSPRELAYEDLPSRVWMNEHLIYTHGNGLTLGVVNQVTREGLPALLVQDIPPVSKTNVKIERPEIYFGEIDNDYIFVNTRQKEFDYPSGEENVFTVYAGKAGIRVDSVFDKILWSLRFGSLKVLLSTDIAPGSRVLYNRAVHQRVQKLVPFLQMDRDPYMVISKGKLYWLLDGYTVSDLYPYSKRTRDLGNYVRNSVVALVDAYNGDVQFFIKDAKDPIIRTYAGIFPGTFKPLSSMDKDIRSHIRYPHWLFRIQANMYSTYHMTEPQTFYNKEDLWQVPASTQSESAMEPYYTIMRLPGDAREEYILMVPFTPSRKDNLSAWMCAKCDPEDYGRLVVYRFPKQKLIYGPRQIESRINQDPEISRQISLWDQRGSNVILGTLLVIPIEESLIYVQPLYIKAETGQIPELKRIIVAYETTIAMDETLEQSLARVVGARAVAPQAVPSVAGTAKREDSGTMAEEAWQHYSTARKHIKDENWAAYGEEMRKLQKVLEQLRKVDR
ncbi:MAG: UPF0182 family protein [Pseudomonadota bacterium]